MITCIIAEPRPMVHASARHSITTVRRIGTHTVTHEAVCSTVMSCCSHVMLQYIPEHRAIGLVTLGDCEPQQQRAAVGELTHGSGRRAQGSVLSAQCSVLSAQCSGLRAQGSASVLSAHALSHFQDHA